MFSLNGINNDLISYPNQLPFSFSFDSNNNNNQNSKQETTNSSSFIQFPHHYSPSFEHNEFPFDQNQNYDLSSLADVMEVSKMAEQVPRKRSAKRDRHSKIKTAKGLRDRRMRLSLEVAKRFFGLQDLLGFDKASKTVEWLLNQAKTEIKHLVAIKKNSSNSSASSTSECDVSGLDEVGNRDQQQHRNSSQRGVKNNNRNNSSKVCRKSAFNSVGRERARERARERTREKKMMMRTRGMTAHHDDDESKKCNRNLLCSWNPFETTTVEHSGTAPPHTKNVNVIQIIEEATQAEAPMEQEDNPNLFIMNKWSQNLILNSLNHNLGILLHHDENQFGEFETLGKPCWEAYNNQI